MQEVRMRFCSKLPVVLVAAAGLAGAVQAQTDMKYMTASQSGRAKVVKAQPPKDPGFGQRAVATDLCAGSPIVGNGGTIDFDTSSASNDYPGTCGLSGASPDVWARVSAAVNSTVTISTCGLSGGDTVLTATRGCGGTQIICVDDSCGLQTTISFPLDAGNEAAIRIAGFNGAIISGSASVTITPRGGGGGGGDDCSSAPLVGVGTHPYDLFDKTNDYAGSCGASASSPDQWYKYTTGAAQELVTASTCGLSSGDTVLSFLDACGGSEIICVDDACGLQTVISAIIEPNTTFYLRIAGYNNSVHAGAVAISSAPVVPPDNDDCADATQITPGGSFDFNTTFASTDGAASCGAFGDPGAQDVWFKFTADRNGAVEAVTCDTTSFDTIVSIQDGCNGTEIGCNDDSCFLQSYATANVTQGQTYYIRVAGYLAASGSGSLAVNYVEPCIISQPNGSTVEPEDCGGDVNGGCNDPNSAVTQVAVDSVIYGSAFSSTTFRDTDWYEFTLASERELVVTGRAEMPLAVAILDATCTDGAPGAIYDFQVSSRPCQEVTARFQLAAGTYRVFAACAQFIEVPCGGIVSNNYILTIGEADTGCAADFNGDGFLDFFDYGDFVTCFEGAGCPDGRDADFNGDAFVDFFDYAAYVEAFETGC
jgi:hypothetical protein